MQAFPSFIHGLSMDEEHGSSVLYSQPSTESTDKWVVWGHRLPKGEIVFLTQAIVIYTVIISAIVNISLGNSSETWLVLLSASVGAILPAPKNHTPKRLVTPRP